MALLPLAALAGALVIAAPASAAKPVTFDEALGLAEKTPEVAGALEAATAKRDSDRSVSGFTSNPELTFNPMLRPDPAPGQETWEGNASLTQTFSLGGLGARRHDAARAETEVLSAEARSVALSRRLAAARTWIDLWAAQKAHEDAVHERDLAADLAARTQRAAEAAALTRAESAEAVAYAAEARLLALSVEGEVTDLGHQLAGDLASGPSPLAASGPLPLMAMPAADRWPDLVARAENAPSVTALRLTAAADRARAAEARAHRASALTLGVGAARDDQARWLATGTIGVSLPVLDRGEREAGAFEASARRADAAARDAATRSATELSRAFHEVQHSGEVLNELEVSVIPAATEAVRLRDASFRAGDATVLEVLVARRAAVAARARLERARAANAWARVKVTLLLAEIQNAAAR